MLPVAPGRFSTATGWPSAGASRSAISLAAMSVVPAGGKPATRRMGRLGQGDWARARPGSRAGAASRLRRRIRLLHLGAAAADDIRPAAALGREEGLEGFRRA